MVRGYALLGTSLGLLLAGCVGDEFLVGGGGSDGAGGGPTTAGSGLTTSTGTTSVTTSSSGATTTTTTASTGSGGCAGCMQDGACTDGTAVDACGSAGEACQVCPEAATCRTRSCNGACGEIPDEDNVPCEFVSGNPTSGACQAGVCEEARENCGNGIDDDEDKLVDCLDSDCDIGFTCVETTPDDWAGPVAVYLGDVGCPAVWGAPAEGEFGVGVGPDSFECDCDCTLIGCETVTFDFGATPLGGDTCAGAVITPQTLDAGDCLALGASGADTIALNADTGAEPECTGVLVEGFTFPPPSFDQAVTVCENPGSEGGIGCDEGACRPRAPDSGGIAGSICVFQEGAVDCPDESEFTTRIVVATGVDDTRDCNCDCVDPGCGAEIGFFDENQCEQCNSSNGACAALGLEEPCASDIPVEAAIFAGWSPAACQPQEAELGALQAAGEITYCCL